MSFRLPILWLSALVFAGCEDRIVPPTGSAGVDISSYLRPMTRVRVDFTASTLLNVYRKESSLDPGSKNAIWSERLYRFLNEDSSYSIEWNDSEFAMKTCFSVFNLSTGGVEDSRCSAGSLLRGRYNGSTTDISDLTCLVSVTEGPSQFQPPDADNYRISYASLVVPRLTLESIYDDSVSFVLSDPSAMRSVALSYSDSERWDATVIKDFTVTQFDTLGSMTPPSCRLVFYSPK